MTRTTGIAAGVPFVAVPPTTPRPDAPVVLAWHLLDPPCTEQAFASAVPLAGVDAWRIYLGLPMCGSRSPGREEIMRLGFEDAVTNLHGPINAQAASEARSAFESVKAQLDIGNGPVGLLGGSAGAGVVLELLATGVFTVDAAVVVSPLVRLRPLVEAIAAQYEFDYVWTRESRSEAARMDYVARSDAIAQACPAVRVIVGADDTEWFREGATALAGKLGDFSDLQIVDKMAHALAEEPGVDPAPQIQAAVSVDELASEWFRSRLL